MIKRIAGMFVLLLVASAVAQSRVSEPSAAQRAAREARATLDRSNKARGTQLVLTTRPARKVEGSIVFAAVTPKLVVDHWMIFIALPPELAGRQEKVRIETRPEAKGVAEPTGAKRPLLMWEIAADEATKNSVAVGVTYHLDLYSRKLNPRTGTNAVKVAPLADPERELYVQTTTLLDYDAAAFGQWLVKNELCPKPGETDIDPARRIFAYVKEKAAFEYKPEMERRASSVCAAMKSDCGGLTALYVAALRANGIPARQLVGRWAQSAKADEKLGAHEWAKEHIKAEFFADGVGWVPVDMSVAVEYDKLAGSVKHFGNDDGDFVCFHVDSDVAFDVPTLGRKSIRFSQEPVVYYLGNGTTEGMNKRSEWTVKVRRM